MKGLATNEAQFAESSVRESDQENLRHSPWQMNGLRWR